MSPNPSSEVTGSWNVSFRSRRDLHVPDDFVLHRLDGVPKCGRQALPLGGSPRPCGTRSRLEAGAPSNLRGAGLKP